MKLCTVTKVIGLDHKEHFAIVAIGKPGWPLALCGPTTNPKSEKEAKFFADAPAMHDMLEYLSKEFGNINPDFPPSNGKVAELALLAERAGRLVAKHQGA